jgi:dTDP-L-rhamnose 4-epimerase
MKILITGGAGFIGSHTADALIAAGHSVRLLDNLHPTVHPKGKPPYLHPKAEFLLGDVRDAFVLRRALEGVETVYHLAAYQDYLPDFSTYFSVNAVSTALIYELLVAERDHFKVRKVIVAASQAVMGEGRYHCPHCAPAADIFLYPEIRLERQLARGIWEHHCATCENTLQWLPSDEKVINPCNQYALSKQSQEQIAIQLGRRYEIPSVVMRYSIVQGPRQSFYNAYSGAMRIFALSLLFDRPPIIFEDGRQIRDFVNIEDVVTANLAVLHDPRADFKVFNVGGGVAWEVNQFYDTVQKTTGKSIEPIMGGHYRYGDTRHIFSDTSALQSLGWAPRRSVHDSIAAYWEYLLQHRDSPDVLAQAEAQMRRLSVIRHKRD